MTGKTMAFKMCAIRFKELNSYKFQKLTHHIARASCPPPYVLSCNLHTMDYCPFEEVSLSASNSSGYSFSVIQTALPWTSVD